MSRTYANFLLFEDVIDNLPETSVVMRQAVDMLLNPLVTIVEEDCGTLLGRQVESTVESEGYIETATGNVLTFDRQLTLLAGGTYRYGIRSLDTCLSNTKGGICRTCYESSFIGEAAPDVGVITTIPAMQIYQTDIIRGDGASTTFTLSQTEDDWYDVKVLKDGILKIEDVHYTLGTDTITFPTPPTITPLEVYTVHFYKQNCEPFLGWVARTYSGSLLGMEPLPTIPPLLRINLYESQFGDSFIGVMMNEINALKVIPSTYRDYLDRVSSRLEKVLLMLYLYAVYANVEV